MDGGIFREGSEGGCGGGGTRGLNDTMRKRILFSLKAEFKLGRPDEALLSGWFPAWLPCSLANIQRSSPSLPDPGSEPDCWRAYTLTFDPIWQM